ncbi:MAG: IS21 family transposase, partial [Alteromonas sp.]
MPNRRFEMYQYRHILVRMRMGDSNRAIADSGIAGRNKVKAIKRIASKHGWLEPDSELPDDTQLATVFGERPPNPTTTSSVAPYADKVKKWYQDGV